MVPCFSASFLSFLVLAHTLCGTQPCFSMFACFKAWMSAALLLHDTKLCFLTCSFFFNCSIYCDQLAVIIINCWGHEWVDYRVCQQDITDFTQITGRIRYQMWWGQHYIVGVERLKILCSWRYCDEWEVWAELWMMSLIFFFLRLQPPLITFKDKIISIRDSPA